MWGFSFLKIGEILAIFKEFGKIPVIIDWFIVVARTGAMISAMCLSRILDIPSWPKLDLVLSLRINFSTNSESTVLKVNIEVKAYVTHLR